MVSLYHRTRTAKGWSLISAQDEVRVTKDRGKVDRTHMKEEQGQHELLLTTLVKNAFLNV
jgi:hypothetical protein